MLTMRLLKVESSTRLFVYKNHVADVSHGSYQSLEDEDGR